MWNSINRPGAAIFLLACLSSRIVALDALDPSFSPTIRVSGAVRCMTWNPISSRFYVSVSGDKFNGQILTSTLVRMDAGGNLDSNFSPVINGLVTEIAVQPDGKTIIAGTFSSVDGHPSSRLARLSVNGTVDTSFVPSGTYLPPEIRSLAVAPDGTIYVGSRDYPGVIYKNGQYVEWLPPLLFKFGVSGTLIEPFGPEFRVVSGGYAPSIESLLVLPSGELVVGGTFTKVGATNQNYLAKLGSDGVLDPLFKPVLTSTATSIKFPVQAIADAGGGKIYIGGNFTKVDGVSQVAVARLGATGARDATFSPVLTGSLSLNVSGMAVDPEGRVLLGGAFTISAGPFSGIAKSNLVRLDSAGVLDTSFGGSIGTWDDLKILPSNDVVVCRSGGYASNGFVQPTMMRVLASGATDESFHFDLMRRDNPESVCVRPGKGPLLRSVWMREVNGVETGSLAATTPTGAVDHSFNLVLKPGETVESALVMPDGRILIGGNFSTVGGLDRPKLALIEADGTPVADFNLGTGPSTNVTLTRLLPSGKVLIGGLFSSINGLDTKGVAVLDPTALHATRNLVVEEILEARYGTASVSSNVLPAVKAALTAGTVNLKVNSTTMGADPAPGYLCYLTVRYRTNRGERTAKVFSSLQLPNVPWDSGLIDLSFRPAHTESLFLKDATGQADGKIILLGSFSTFAGQSIPKMVRVGPDGSLDTSFQPASKFTNFSANVVRASPGGQIYFGTESLSPAGASTTRGLYRLTSSGLNDTTFACPAFIRHVNAIELLPDGGLWCSGGFTSSLAGERNQVARLLPTGAVDARFDAGTAANQSYATADHAIATDGPDQLWLAGDFTAFQGIPRDGVARIHLVSGIAPLAQVVPKSLTVPDGTPVTFGLKNAGSNETYTWLRDGVTIQGATGPTLTVTSDVPTVTRTYTAQVANSAGTTVSSATLAFREADFGEWTAARNLNGLQPSEDADGDGASNLSEYLARTDPADSRSIFSSGMEVQPGGMRFRWNSYPGRQYGIDQSADLSTWSPVGATIIGDGTEKSISLLFPAAVPKRYWRLWVIKP